MKKTALLLPFLLLAASSFGQTSDIEKEIREMDQKNATVIVKPDSAALVALLDPGFTINRTTGSVVSGRAKTQELFQKGIVGYDSFSVQTEHVLVKSAILAISMGSEVVTLSGNSGTKGQPVKRRFTHVWTKENNQWQLLARHANVLCTP